MSTERGAANKMAGARLAAVVLLCGLATPARAQHTFLLWCSTSSGAATMTTPQGRAFGVVGQGAIGETRGGGFVVRGGFASDTVVMNAVVGTAEEAELPSSYALDQNYPNPFNPATTIRYALRARQHVELAIYTILGDRVETLVDADEEAGVHHVTWRAGGVASGVYFCRLRTAEFTATRKLMLLR